MSGEMKQGRRMKRESERDEMGATVGYFEEERKRAFQQKPGGSAFRRFNKS